MQAWKKDIERRKSTSVLFDGLRSSSTTSSSHAGQQAPAAATLQEEPLAPGLAAAAPGRAQASRPGAPAAGTLALHPGMRGSAPNTVPLSMSETLLSSLEAHRGGKVWPTSPGVASFSSTAATTAPLWPEVTPRRTLYQEASLEASHHGHIYDYSAQHKVAQHASDVEAELRSELAEVRAAIASREEQLRHFASTDGNAAGADTWHAGSAPSELGCLREEVGRVHDEVAAADAHIIALEERLRRHALPAAGALTAGTIALGVTTVREECLRDRVKALERELRSETAALLESQDRIHWLRGQIRRQPSAQLRGSVDYLLAQVKDRIDVMPPYASRVSCRD